MTKVTIISGFLGAGKTTLIKKLLLEKALGERPVIIENEFGEIGIDGGFLRETGVEIREMNSGCICCSLVGDFSLALGEVLRRFSPEHILIEPSGVGKLSDVARAVRREESRGKLSLGPAFTVVDAVKFSLYLRNFSEFFKDQIMHADAIVLSRTERATPEALLAIAGELRALNPAAGIITTPWEALTAEHIFEAAQGAQALPRRLERTLPGGLRVRSAPVARHDAQEVFDVWGTQTPAAFSQETVRAILTDLQGGRYGTVLRAKGMLREPSGGWFAFDHVPGETEIRPCAPDYTGRLCVIGTGLDKPAIARAFGQ